MDRPSSNNDEESSSSPSGEGAESPASEQRWTCEACGCNTNSESDRSCTICGTSRSNGSSILRRAGYAARASGLFGRNPIAVRRNILSNHNNSGGNEDLHFGGMLMDGYYHDFFESVIDGDIDMGGPSAASAAADDDDDDDDDHNISDMAWDVASTGSRSAAARLRAVMAMRGDHRPFAVNSRESSTQRLSPEELLRAANDNNAVYEPKWMNPSEIGGRTRSCNGIEVGDGPNQNVAYLPLGAGEGRALRALEALPRSAPFASFSLAPGGVSSSSMNSGSLLSASGPDRRARRVFGFKVAFGHPSKEKGESMGGRYLVGVTTTSFSSFSDKGALQQSPFFFGIDDAGNKYEGPRHRHDSSSSSGRDSFRGRRRSSYAVELGEDEAPRNEAGVLFGSREVITCTVDLESRTLTFWREEDGESKLLGTLVTNIPRGGQLYPIVVPHNAGSTVSITGMSGEPLPLLDSFASTWKQAQREKDIARRREMQEGRAVLIEDGSFKQDLLAILKEIFSRYASEGACELSQVEASRLWYRCGLRLDSLKDNLAKVNKDLRSITFEDFLSLLQRIMADDEKHYPLLEPSIKFDECSDFQIGEKVELVRNYERFGDAASGPLLHGDRGTIIEFQGVEGLRQSIRVIYNGRRWWYQPQALVSEKSGLIDSPGIWLIKGILRSHGYDQNKLELLVGTQVSPSSWKIGDFVAPKKVKGGDRCKSLRSYGMDEAIGRIVPESSTSGPFASRTHAPSSVNVEFVSKPFAENTSLQMGSSFRQKSLSLETRKVSITRLVHTSPYHGLSVSLKPRNTISMLRPPPCDDNDDEVEAMDVDNNEHDASDNILSDFQKVKDLDPLAIERITKEFDQTSTSLMTLVEAGLPRAVLEALDSLMNNIQLSDDDGGLAEAVSALGKLALHVAEKSFPDECCRSTNVACNNVGNKDEFSNPRDSDPSDTVANGPLETSHENTGLSIEVPSGRDSRSPSLIQRRRMLLSFMSRARRAGGGSLGDILSREMQGLPPMEMSADTAEALFLATRNEGNGFENNNSHLENSRPTEPEESAMSTEIKSSPSNSSNETLLDDILRGRSHHYLSTDAEGRCVIPLLSIKNIVLMGILGNSLPWLKTLLKNFAQKAPRKYNATDVPILKHAFDDDKMPLLELAISLGCSVPIIEELIRYGAPVTKAEVQLAAEFNMPGVLSILLKYLVYCKGTIDLETCSPDIVTVVLEAQERQTMQNEKLRAEADSFLASFTQKMMQIGLKRRQQQRKGNDVCGRAIASVLVGNIELCALRRRENTASLSDSHESQVLGMNSCGLLQVLPLSVLGGLFSNGASLTDLLLLIEDYLCSKGINDGCVGLTMLLALLQSFPKLNQSPEIDRYGFVELVDSHRALSLNRLAEITSSITKRNLSEQKPDEGTFAAPEVVFCPKKHPAVLHVTTHSSFRCDLCGVGVECGAIMYGCRDCDWDACETCTDKVEGGVIKWKYVRELSSKCQALLNRDSMVGDVESNDQGDVWVAGMIESLGLMDNSSEVNTLSIRLLQRDLDSVQGLAHMLRIKGSITMHQFLMVILPALHSALVGKSPSSGQSTCRRTKKPRVAGVRCHDNEGRFIDTNDGERLEFAKELLKFLMYNNSPHSGSGNRQGNSQMSQDSNGDDGGILAIDDEYEENEEMKSKENILSTRELPELFRRIHQVLSLHEEVKTINAVSGTKKEDVSPGDLRSLKQPIKLRLTPYVATGSEPEDGVIVLSEPLVSVEDLSRHILKTASATSSDYVDFCRKLAEDSAIILECPLSSVEDVWRIANVVSYNDKVGYHGVRYASAFQSESGFEHYINFQGGSGDSRLEFDTNTTKLVLSARKYFIVRREKSSDRKSAFDMEQLLAEGMNTQNEETPSMKSLDAIGTLVESDFTSSSWSSYTIIGTDISDTGEKYDLLSEDGEVVCSVPADRIKGIDPNKSSIAEMSSSGESQREVNVSARRSIEAGDHISRAFPFLLAGNRQATQGESPPSRRHGSKKPGRRLLTRTWSGLALVESMCPAEVSVASGAEQEITSNCNRIKLTCSVGSRRVRAFVEERSLEFAPSFQMQFRSNLLLSPITICSQRDTTLISLLHKLYQGEVCDIFRAEPHQIFYSVTYQSSMTRKRKNHMVMQKMLSISNPRLSKSVDISDASMDTECEDKSHLQNWVKDEKNLRLMTGTNFYDHEELGSRCKGLDEICVQCMEIIEFLARIDSKFIQDKKYICSGESVFVNQELSQKLIKQTEDPLFVVGGTVPEWCLTIPAMIPHTFSYASRKLLLDRVAFGVSRSTLRQQDAKVNVGRLRKRMTTLRARAVELVGEAFSGGSEDPTALQLQADELYGMEEALATRVRAAFRDEGWEEMSLQVAKAAIHRDCLLSDAMSIMEQYSSDKRLNRRRLEVRFDGESGFDAASGDEAGVTRGFYADIAEALMSCDTVAGVAVSGCTLEIGLKTDLDSLVFNSVGKTLKLPLWIPDVDSSGQVIIPTPRAMSSSIFGVFPRPMSKLHPQFSEVLKYFRFMGQLFAAAMRDGFMFPLPLSASFLKLVQYSGENSVPQFDTDCGFRGSMGEGKQGGCILSSEDLPRPGFLGGEIYAVEMHICHALDRIDQEEPHLSEGERERAYRLLATDKNFARNALGKNYDCSFVDYFEDRRFVDPLDPTQGITAHPLCSNGFDRSVTIHNIREWITCAKHFMLHEGVRGQAAAFKAGIGDFFSSEFLRLLTSEELQRDVCGMGDNVDDWEKEDIMKLLKLDGKAASEAWVAVAAIRGNTEALGRRLDPASKTIQFLVKALLEASTVQRRQFLSFVTSVPIVTPGLIEVIPIVSSSGKFLPMEDPGCLPRANTCARRLYLPKFDSFESFSGVLWAVVKAESKHKGFFEWNL